MAILMAIALKRAILKDPLIRKVFSKGKNIYLVGGYLRDIFIEGKPPERPYDVDFVLKEDLGPIVNTLSAGLKASIVELKKDHMLRVALRDGSTMDFSLIIGDLLSDLKRRDFTFNAMAWSPEEGLIDLFGGLRDIRKKIIRGILKNNFKDDPLRLLRAYRFSSEFSFPISKEMRQIVRELSPFIKLTASERITLEFLKLIEGKSPQKALKMALKDGLLTNILSFNSKGLERNINLLSRIEQNLKELSKVRACSNLMGIRFPQGLSYGGLLRLEAILAGSDHLQNLLRLSTTLRKRVEIVSRLMGEFKKMRGSTPLSRLFEPFEKAHDALIDLLLLTGRLRLIRKAQRFLNVKKRGVLSSEEILKETGIEAGPELGKLINELKRLKFLRVIRTRREALRYLRSLRVTACPTKDLT